MKQPQAPAAMFILVTMLLVVLFACVAGCAPSTPDPACSAFYDGQPVKTKSGPLYGMVYTVFRYRGEVIVHMQGLPASVTMYCQDLEPVAPRGVE